MKMEPLDRVEDIEDGLEIIKTAPNYLEIKAEYHRLLRVLGHKKEEEKGFDEVFDVVFLAMAETLMKATGRMQ